MKKNYIYSAKTTLKRKKTLSSKIEAYNSYYEKKNLLIKCTDLNIIIAFNLHISSSNILLNFPFSS